MTYAQDLLASARKSLSVQDGAALTASDCNRAVSTAYYAVFDCLCSAVANRLAGSLTNELTPSDSWVRIYQSLDHRTVRDTLLRATNARNSMEHPLSVVATLFERLHTAREHADYVRNADFDVEAALALIFGAQFAVDEIEDSEPFASEKAVYLTQIIVELILPKSKR